MIETPDPCLAGKGCNQHCNQGDYCPLTNPHAAQEARMRDARAAAPMAASPGVKVANIGKARPALPHPPGIHLEQARHTPMPKITGNRQAGRQADDERAAEEREGRVDTALETVFMVMVALFTVMVVGIGSGYIYTRWGDAIGSAITNTLLAWGRVWT